ncbi:MAG: hypothetical protein AAGH15_09790 [Myxococcota bacterium]
MRFGFLAALIAPLAAAFPGCSSSPEGVAIQASFLSGSIPDEVVAFRALVLDGEGRALRRGPLVTVASLEDADGNGRRELVVPELPTGQDIEVQLRAFDRLSAEAVTAVGSSGPLFLQAGERRNVRVALYEVGRAQPVPTVGPGERFLHAATRLSDGRVLISGGFAAPEARPCPEGADADARCFAAVARSDAWLFEPAGARWFEVRGGGLATARAGHTATALPDGRVLVAGGATAALLVLAPQRASDGGRNGFVIQVVPEDGDGAPSASTGFELFEPELGAEVTDVERDGDPGRGRFVGAADGSGPGRLNRARFLHAAAALPDGRVLLAGGAGDAARTAELFDASRPGGYGVGPELALTEARAAPSAVTLIGDAGPEVWIFGGVSNVASATGLAERWRPGDLRSRPASEASDFPGEAGPELALLRPTLVTDLDQRHVLVHGWYGPRCPVDDFAGVPEASTPGDGRPLCNHVGGPERSVVVEAGSGATVRNETPIASRQSFGAATRLPDGRSVLTGGITNASLAAGLAVTVVEARANAEGRLPAAPLATANLLRARAFHRTTSVGASSALSTGGLRVSEDDTGAPTIGLAAFSEVITFAPPEVDDSPAGTTLDGGSVDAGTPDAGTPDAGDP